VDEELKKRLLDYMDTLDGAVREGGDFVLEQSPLVVQEYITYSRVVHTSLVLLAFAIAAAMVFVCIKYGKSLSNTRNDGVMILSIIGAFVAPITVMGLLIKNLDPCIMSWFAPRLLILEKVADLIK